MPASKVNGEGDQWWRDRSKGCKERDIECIAISLSL
jgi:hypothetical protein